MRILIIMDPGILVPPKGYGGHERLVEMFAIEYKRLGHEVHLLVTEGSFVPGCEIHNLGKEGFPPKKSDSYRAIIVAWIFLLKNYHKFDLIHNFGRLAYLIPILNKPINKVMTYGREVHAPNIKKVHWLKNKNIIFTGPSQFCVKSGNVAGDWQIIPNAIDFSKYTLRYEISDDAPLIFLSRLERLKGAHEAIAIALSLGEKLIIAGNISPLQEEIVYFKREIEPFIDNKQITYVGVLDDIQKNKFLGMSKAMLFPARTEEAFGMVMVESMACGTPVIAYNHAAMPEVIDEGITGFIVSDLDEMKKSLCRIKLIDRKVCRNHAENRFDVKKVAKQYLKL
jgi:glycosyltransferase involved in cell wall biosynthesis